MPKTYLDGKWRETTDFDWFLDFCDLLEWFWWRVFLPVLLGMGAGYALAWYHYVGRYSGSG